MFPLLFLYHSLQTFLSTQAKRQKPVKRQRQNEELLTFPMEWVDLNPGEQEKNVSEVRQPVEIP